MAEMVGLANDESAILEQVWWTLEEAAESPVGVLEVQFLVLLALDTVWHIRYKREILKVIGNVSQMSSYMIVRPLV